MARILGRAARRDEILRPTVADIRLGRPDIALVRSGLDPRRFHANQVGRDLGAARLRQQLLDDALGLVVLALAEMVMTNFPARVDEIVRWPILIGEAAPDRVVAVNRDRI